MLLNVFSVRYFAVRSAIIPFCAAIDLFGVTPASAEPAKYEIKMTLGYLGISVGKFTNRIDVDGDRYAIRGDARTNAIVSIVAKTDARFDASGKIAGRRAIPDSHTLSYAQRKKQGNLRLAFASGNVVNAVSTPKVKYKKGSIPVTQNHLRGVLDPVSSLVFPVAVNEVGNGPAICNRTVPVFDGKNRMDLKFIYKSTSKAKVKGFSGPTFTCSVRYEPVAGMRMHKKNIKFMKSNRNMEVTLARLGETNVYALFGFRVKTQRGTATGNAYKFAKR